MYIFYRVVEGEEVVVLGGEGERAVKGGGRGTERHEREKMCCASTVLPTRQTDRVKQQINN